MVNTHSRQPPARPKRYRKPGSLAQLRGMLWEGLLAAASMIDEPSASEDRKVKGMHALAQLSGCYLKVVEVHDLAAKVAALEAAFKAQGGRV
jgi:hypothetical protein